MAAQIVERKLSEPWQGFIAEPARGIGGAGVLVLAGSSGRIERERCRLLARTGVTSMSIRWFGGPGQPPGVCEVPLETFVAATELLRRRGNQRVSILGVSKGAEAALVASTLSDCADAVIGLAPSSVVWGNVGAGRDGREFPYRSSWTWHGQPLPFVPYADDWSPTERHGAPISVLGWYEHSLTAYADRLPAAAIEVDKADTEVVLVAGGADRMWPSLHFARQLADRRAAAGGDLVMISRAAAGHRTVFPGEVAPPPSTRFAHGGTPDADAQLGTAAWPHVLAAIHGTPAHTTGKMHE